MRQRVCIQCRAFRAVPSSRCDLRSLYSTLFFRFLQYILQMPTGNDDQYAGPLHEIIRCWQITQKVVDDLWWNISDESGAGLATNSSILVIIRIMIRIQEFLKGIFTLWDRNNCTNTLITPEIVGFFWNFLACWDVSLAANRWILVLIWTRSGSRNFFNGIFTTEG